MSPSILIVEDRRDTARDLKSILGREFGHDITIVNDGAEAVALARSKPHDVTLLDIDLPVLNGFEVLALLEEQRIPTRVIMLTGVYMDIDSAVKAIKAGACDYLVKPVNSAKLIEHIKKAMVTESTINLRMASEVPPLTRELIQRLENQRTSESQILAGHNPLISESTDNLKEKISKHWFIVLVVLTVAIGTVLWAVLQQLFVAPRDFEIGRLRSALEQTHKAQPPQVSPK